MDGFQIETHELCIFDYTIMRSRQKKLLVGLIAIIVLLIQCCNLGMSQTTTLSPAQNASAKVRQQFGGPTPKTPARDAKRLVI